MIFGPPESGKRGIASLLCKKLNTILITMESILSKQKSKDVLEYDSEGNLEAHTAAKLIQTR